MEGWKSRLIIGALAREGRSEVGIKGRAVAGKAYPAKVASSYGHGRKRTRWREIMCLRMRVPGRLLTCMLAQVV
jgi:hypothetical protein